MKRILKFAIPCCLVIVAAVAAIILLGCNKNPGLTKEEGAVVQVNVNPSISFVVSEDGTVISVYGENDEGKMLVSGEIFIDLPIDEAIEKIIEIENETGYLVSGNVEANENKISITIEASKDEVLNSINDKVNNKVNEVCEKLNIKENLEINALLEKETYTVVFYDENGNVLKEEQVKYGESANAPTVDNKEGYTFKGWDEDITSVKGDLEVTPVYEEKVFNVVFKDDEGNVIKETKTK